MSRARARTRRVLQLCLLATGVLMAVHLMRSDISGLVEDVALAMALGQYYHYRSNIEHFVEAIGPLTSDGT